MKPRHKWTPMRRADFKPGNPEALIQDAMRLAGMTREEAIRQLDKSTEAEVWVNDIYQVAVSDHGEDFIQLNIRRRDGGPILRDWRHFQRIKNEIVGEEHEGVELYPAESRLVDTANKFHIFVLREPGVRFPFGWDKRDVQYESGSVSGSRQRSL
jgi:hypothetical protein